MYKFSRFQLSQLVIQVSNLSNQKIPSEIFCLAQMKGEVALRFNLPFHPVELTENCLVTVPSFAAKKNNFTYKKLRVLQERENRAISKRLPQIPDFPVFPGIHDVQTDGENMGKFVGLMRRAKSGIGLFPRVFPLREKMGMDVKVMFFPQLIVHQNSR